MSDSSQGINSPQSDNLNAQTATTGVVVTAVRSGASKGCTLANATTYYFALGIAPGASQLSAHLMWASAVVATFTLECSNFPASGASATDVTDYSTTAGEWQQFNSPSAYVPTSGTGNTSVGATVTAGGTAAGSAFYDMSLVGARRMRIKVVVTTGGVVRCGVHGKV